MVSQHAISKQIRHWQKMFLVQLQEQIVIPLLKENIFTMICLANHTAIVDVIIGIVEEWGRAGHISYVKS